MNVVAGSVTVAAGVLGVSGVTAGVATALLRNITEATLTATVIAGAGVLVGLVSAFVPRERTFAGHPRMLRAGLVAATGLVVWMWAIIGWSFVDNAGRSPSGSTGWVAFLAAIALSAVALAVVAGRHPQWPVGPVLTVGALYVFGSAVLGLVVLTATVLRTTARPTITTTTRASGESAVSMTATVSASGLSSRERYEIAAQLLDREMAPTRVDTRFRTYAGPDALGNLTYTFSIEIPRAAGATWVVVGAALVQEGSKAPSPAGACGLSTGQRLPVSGVTCTLIHL
ncbi:hypothetical protein JOL79_10485 [Microbispora sp. RL4-1S]|uniref:Uncharacterized protein n=1 Tax=Microbispora oryzae TaxID=2806554 RepID=A0A940WHS7_9ACTN|nr:hypothetical protein [Microbispora oryzae]MBP2704237.1 hypothetical protein [Microbispora oryzae]